MKNIYNFCLIIMLASVSSFNIAQVSGNYNTSTNSIKDAGNSISLINPPNNSITSLKNIDFTWNSVGGALSYKLQISRDPNFTNNFFVDSTLTDTFRTVSVLDPDASYYWKVSGKNDSGYFISSAVWNFGLQGLHVTLINPSLGENFVSIPVTFEWTSANSAINGMHGTAPYQNNIPLKSIDNVNSSTQYLLEIAFDKKFNSIVYQDSTILDTFQTVSSLEINTVYYWRITPQNDSFFFGPSATFNFNTFQSELLLNSPADSMSVPLPVEFSWFGDSNAVTYKLEVAIDIFFSVIVYSDSTLTDTSQVVDVLKLGLTYYWRVSAKNDSTYFANSVIRTFFTESITPIVLHSPPNNDSSVTIPIEFSWFRESEAVSYKLEVATDSSFGFGTIAFRDTSITDTFKVVGSLDFGTVYYWRVFAKNNFIYYTGSPIWKFTTVTLRPTYNLYVRNMSLESINAPDDALEFDVYIEHTNPPAEFEYAGGQYFLSFNSNIIGINFADTNEATYRIIGSDLPAGMQPVNPSMSTAAGPAASILSLSINAFPGAGNGYIMTNNGFPGTKIVRMRILKKTGTFNLDYLSLAWRNPPITSFVTRTFAYVDSVVTDITSPETHNIDSSGIGILPVEFSSLVSNVNSNNVNLNWTTESEINNFRFDVERKLFDSNDKNDWIKAGSVRGNGTTNDRTTYSFSERLNTGKYNYRLKQIDFNGNYKYYFLSNEVEVGAPSDYSLSQNYPNPFNPSTKIYYDLPYNGNVSIILYDISGREAATLVKEFKQAGYYSIQFNGSNLSSGMYFYTMSVNSIVISKKMMLVK